MSGFDVNPFGDPQENNPFADPAITQVTNQTTRVNSGLDDYNPFANQPQNAGNVPQYQKPSGQDSTNQPATMKPVVAEPPPAYTPTAAQAVNTAELQRRQDELERKAAELAAKEEALRNMQPFNARANNWPPLPARCCVQPCFYQDIAVDIPLEFQRVVRAVYYLWMFYVCVLCLNLLGALAIMFSHNGFTTFGFSILALVLFTPLSFLCWFRPLYKAFRSDSSFNFMVFFFVFFFQFVLCTIYAAGIPGVGSCGIINGITIISASPATGTDYAVGGMSIIIGFLWGMASLMNFVLLIKVHRIYRSTGASFAKAQEEFTSGVLRNEHVQSAATNVAAGAARTAVQQTFSSGTNRY